MSASHQNDQAGAELEARAKRLLGDITSIEEPKANGSAGPVQYANTQDLPAHVEELDAIGTIVDAPSSKPANGNGHSDPAYLKEALRMAARGVNVFFIPAGQKGAKLDGWEELCTTDPVKIREMAAQHPTWTNFGAVGKAIVRVPFTLDVDDLKTIEEYEKLHGPMPTTLRAQSCNGGFHYYLAHSEKSVKYQKEIGKAFIKETGSDGELWSLRMHNSYVVGPSSKVTRDDGSIGEYKIVQDAPIAEIPDSLLDFLIERLGKALEAPEATHATAPAGEELTKIPRGGHDVYLAQEAGKLRKMGLTENTIADALIELCELRLKDYGSDYKDMARKVAHSIAKHKPDPDGVAIVAKPVAVAVPAVAVAEPVPWQSCFKGAGELPEGEVQLPVQGFLQEGITFIGALPGEGKSWLALSLAKALTTGMPFLGRDTFKVSKVTPVLYLAAESGGRAFRKRCEKLGITKDRSLFLTRTISDGPTLFLNAPQVLEAVREMKPVVIIDTMIRFSRSTDENASAQNKQLVDDVVSLITAGAVAVVIIHHSTKAMRKEGMGLETVLRGTGDIAALADCVYGMLRDDKLFNGGHGPCEIEIQCVKPPRDFDQPLPFRIAASYRTSGTIVGPSTAPGIISYLETIGDFKVIRTQKAPVDPNPALPNQKLSDAEVCSKARDLIAAAYGRGGTINKGQLAVMLGLNRKNADRVLNGDPDNPWSCIPGKRTEVFFVPKGVTVLPETQEETAEEN